MSEEEKKESLEEKYKDFEESLSKKEDVVKEQLPEPPEEIEVEWDEDSAKTKKEEEDKEDEEEPEEEFYGKPSEKKDSSAKVPRNKMFDENPDSVDSIMREALTDNPDAVPITEVDKTSYIKAMLNDKPVILDIPLCNEQLSVSIRSRTAWEQTCLYAALKRDQDNMVMTDLASVIIQLQKYGCALMLLKVNGSPFSDLDLKQEDGLDKCVDLLIEYKDSKIEKLSMPKWALLLNALRIFESKLSRMGTECLNSNFWEPVD